MKIVMTLLVRNEEDIIRANIDFHRAVGVDYFIVTDNLSTDGTKDILLEYARQGCLHYIHEDSDHFMQHVWVTRMARMAASEISADWVINNDADEFWWPRSGNLRDAFAQVPPSAAGLDVRRNNFVARPIGRGQDFLAQMRYRDVESLNILGQPIQSKACHRADPEIDIMPGNHGIKKNGNRIKLPATDDIEILHYPQRTRAQFSRKIALGGAAYERSGQPKGLGRGWRVLHKKQKEEGLDNFFSETVHDEARIAARLAAGEIVEDRRLIEFFARHNLPTVREPIVRRPAVVSSVAGLWRSIKGAVYRGLGQA